LEAQKAIVACRAVGEGVVGDIQVTSGPTPCRGMGQVASRTTTCSDLRITREWRNTPGKTSGCRDNPNKRCSTPGKASGAEITRISDTGLPGKEVPKLECVQDCFTKTGMAVKRDTEEVREENLCGTVQS
jgi:hypothetical protein